MEAAGTEAGDLSLSLPEGMGHRTPGDTALSPRDVYLAASVWAGCDHVAKRRAGLAIRKEMEVLDQKCRGWLPATHCFHCPTENVTTSGEEDRALLSPLACRRHPAVPLAHLSRSCLACPPVKGDRSIQVPAKTIGGDARWRTCAVGGPHRAALLCTPGSPWTPEGPAPAT